MVTVRTEFESSVILQGTKTFIDYFNPEVVFESSVILQGTKTQNLQGDKENKV